MLRRSPVCLNTYLSRTSVAAPISIIRSADKFWSDPERLIKYKMLYFTLGIDQQPLRRTAVIRNEMDLRRGAPKMNLKRDVTGFRRARYKQAQMWYRRMQYQEYFLQHLFTRHAWGLLRKYPPMGAKIDGVCDDGYFGDTPSGVNLYTRQVLPFPQRKVFEPRK